MSEKDAAIEHVLSELSTHHAGSVCFASVSDSLLFVTLCSDTDGEKEFLELDGDTWRTTYDQLRGPDTCVVVDRADRVRTW